MQVFCEKNCKDFDIKLQNGSNSPRTPGEKGVGRLCDDAEAVIKKSFADAEARKDGVEELGGGDVAGDVAEVGDGLAHVFGDEVGRDAVA